jgi:autoinducer 2 (AI-2) kinase
MRVRVNSAAMPQMNQTAAIRFVVGLTARWFRDAFCAEEMRQAEAQGRDAYS